MLHRLSNFINGPVPVVFLVIVVVTLTSLGALNGQDKRHSQPKLDETQFPIVEEYSTPPLNPKARMTSEAKAKRFRMNIPALADSPIGVSVIGYHWPQNFSPLPVAESTTIILGEITEAKANLSEDRYSVYSDFTINPLKVFKDDGNLVKANEVLTTSRLGGRVKFQNGKTLLVFNSGLGMPRVEGNTFFFSNRQRQILTFSQLMKFVMTRLFP